MAAMLGRLPGGPPTLLVFVAILLAYTVQTEATQYIQHTLRYEKPLLLLYVTHSSFLFLLPSQLAVLRVRTGKPASHFLGILRRDVQRQVDHVRYLCGLSPAPTTVAFYLTAAGIVLILTIGVTIPALSWFVALPFTSMANVTSIYNTFSIWALVFSVLFLRAEWNYVRRLLTQIHVLAVLFGALGVGIVAYASTQPAENASSTTALVVSHNLLGNGLAFLGAVSMAAYEVVYKVIGTVPDANHGMFQPLAHSEEHAEDAERHDASHHEESLPFGMHAIAMTSGIGVMTLGTLWLVLLVAHLIGFEPFEMPPNWTIAGWIALGAVCGVLFNGCFSILLSLWGPVLASMSCLLTTVFVQFADIALGVPFTWIGLGGCAVIAISFVCLLPWGNKD